MADNLTISQRKVAMKSVRSKDTKPEICVRKLVHRLGYRFRLDCKDLPGKPDLVLPRHKKVIFVHGCFWHGHAGCSASKKPTSNVDYWIPKLERNRQRDRENLTILEKQGWTPLVVWECETRNKKALTKKLIDFLNPTPQAGTPFRFYEFFAGGGMARRGLRSEWSCILANEICEKKAASYRLNHNTNGELKVEDVAKLKATDLPGFAELSWASFPCQDLSLAGNGEGLAGERSGTFWPFWNLMVRLGAQHRKVPIVVLENVPGALTSNRCRDFSTIMEALVSAGYQAGAMVVDAAHFVPQSRPRLFIVAFDADREIPAALLSENPLSFCHTKSVIEAYGALPEYLKQNWVWWNLQSPNPIEYSLSDIIEKEPVGVQWHTQEETLRLLGMMTETNHEKVRAEQGKNRLVVGTLYKRTRSDGNGGKVQRAEVRFDQVSGCLRTPAGGSSRQTVILVNGDEIRSRLLSPREAARLMGLKDDYVLPEKYNEAYHLIGDGLVVPVVEWLAEHILTPLAKTLIEQRED